MPSSRRGAQFDRADFAERAIAARALDAKQIVPTPPAFQLRGSRITWPHGAAPNGASGSMTFIRISHVGHARLIDNPPRGPRMASLAAPPQHGKSPRFHAVISAHVIGRDVSRAAGFAEGTVRHGVIE